MNLRVAAIQSDLYWEDKEKNLEMFNRKIDETGEVDLIVLPEMFTTGFSMNAKSLAEDMNGLSIHWMKMQAQKKSAVICGSMIISDNEKYYNRMVCMYEDGHYELYDKRHLFSLAKEHETYSAGAERKIVVIKEWRCLLNVCYDLRFPVWSRNNRDYDCIINVANWPKVRSLHWNTLLKARAIENLSYMIGVNRYGTDGKDHYYSGNSAIIDPLGNELDVAHDENKTIYGTLTKEQLLDSRTTLGFLKDRDDFSITGLSL